MKKLLEAYGDVEEDQYESNQTEKELSCNDKASISKIRNIPHINGNFSSYIYLNIGNTKKISKIKESITGMLNSTEKNINFEEIPPEKNSYHISLTSNFYLKLHEIDNFLTSIKKEFELAKRQKLILLNKVKYLSNEFNSRNFMTLEILRNKSYRNLINKINKILTELKITKNYSEFLPHISIFWSNTNFNDLMSEDILNLKLKSGVEDDVVKIFTIEEIYIKIGEKITKINLN